MLAGALFLKIFVHTAYGLVSHCHQVESVRWYELNFRILSTPLSSNKYCPLIPFKTPDMTGVLSKPKETTLVGYFSTG